MRARERCSFDAAVTAGASPLGLTVGNGLCWAVARTREWQLLLSPLTLFAAYIGARLGIASLQLAERL